MSSTVVVSSRRTPSSSAIASSSFCARLAEKDAGLGECLADLGALAVIGEVVQLLEPLLDHRERVVGLADSELQLADVDSCLTHASLPVSERRYPMPGVRARSTRRFLGIAPTSFLTT